MKDSEIDSSLCRGNVSENFTINNIKKTMIKEVINFFSVDFNPIDKNDILDIYKYLTERTWYKINVWNY